LRLQRRQLGSDDTKSQVCPKALWRPTGRHNHFSLDYALSALRDPKSGLDDLDIGSKVCPWEATVLAGIAERAIPRRFIALLLPVFRD